MDNYQNTPKAPITQPIEKAPEVGGIYDMMPQMPMYGMQPMCCIPVYCMPMTGMQPMLSPSMMEPNIPYQPPMYGGAQDPNMYGTPGMYGAPGMPGMY